MLNVLYITNIPAPYTVDFFNELGKYMVLTVLFERSSASDRDTSWKSFNANHFSFKILNGKKIGADSALCFDVIKYIDKSKFDLVVIGDYASLTGMLATTYLKIKRIPYAIHADGGMISNDFIIKFLLKEFFLGGAALYFSSGKTTSEYYHHYGVPVKKIREYPFTSVKECQIVSNQDKQKCKSLLGFENQLTIVSVGQIIPRKGFDILIKSVALLKENVDLYIIGGEPSIELKELMADMHLNNIHFLPFLPFDKVHCFIAAADVFVLTTREDIWGLVINEALSAGTPIVSTTKCVASVELVENGINGFVVAPNDPKATAAALDQLLSNNDLRTKIINNNLQKAKIYTIENMAKVYANIISDHLKTS